MRLIPVYLSSDYGAVRETDHGNTLELPPSAWAEAFPEAPQIPNAGAHRNELDVRYVPKNGDLHSWTFYGPAESAVEPWAR